MKKVTKYLAAASLTIAMTLGLSSCSSCDRMVTDLGSDINGGLDRVINVYTADGKLMAHYEGKIDLAVNNGGYVKFDFEGKRYIYYNCFVESIGDI